MKKVFRTFNELLNKKQKVKLIFLLVMMIIGAILETLGVTMIIPIITIVIQPDFAEKNSYVQSFTQFIGINTTKELLIVCIICLILVFFVKDVFLIIQTYAQVGFVAQNRFELQKRLLKSIFSEPYEYFLYAKSGEIFRSVYGDVVQAYTVLSNMLSLLSELIVSFFLSVTILVVNPTMTMLMVAVLVCVAVIIVVVVRPVISKAGVENKVSAAMSNKWLLQGIAGMKEIKISQKESFFLEKFDYYGEKIVRSEKISSTSQNIPRMLIEMICVNTLLIYMIIVINMENDIIQLVPTLGAFAMAAVRLMPSANRIVSTINSTAYCMPALDNLLQSLKKTDINAQTDYSIDKDHDKSTLKFVKNIELNNITFSYTENSKNIFVDAHMSIPAGKSVGIVGKSGSGKTTIVDIMLGLLKPSRGDILVDGISIFDVYAEWLNCIGYIPQNIYMLDDSIKNNVAFGVEPELIDEKRVKEVLEEANLLGFVNKLPEGIDTEIGERGVRISGGQRQRIGIARALYHNPSILIFDEATSALDIETEAAIMEAVERLHGKKTLVIIAHRLQTIENCDIVYRVTDEKIIRER